MGYQIEKTGETAYDVKKGEKVHMRVTGPVAGQPPERGEHTSDGPDLVYTMGIAALAVRYVRKMLPLGAFNNQMLINGVYRYLTHNVAPKWLNARAETMYGLLAYPDGRPRDPVTQMAARSLATLAVKGGVCSLMTYVTAGSLTVVAKQGTKIVTVFDNRFDHAYVVLYYGTSPYVVADPWVGTSYTCLWDDCLFPPAHVSVYTLMEIEETLTVPYGVVFPPEEVLSAKSRSEIDRIDNPPKNQILLGLDEQSLDKKNKYSWFHMDSAYAHPDNIKPKERRKYRSVVGPEDWGTTFVPVPPPHRKSKKDAIAWADQAATMFPDTFN